MIKAVMVMDTQGQASPGQILRLSAYGEAAGAYSQRLFRFVFLIEICLDQKRPFIIGLFRGFMFLCSRAENVSNFVQADSIFGPDSRLVHKHFATLYFVFVFDSSENELAMLDLLQVFVETLDKCFKNYASLTLCSITQMLQMLSHLFQSLFLVSVGSSTTTFKSELKPSRILNVNQS
ncbi:hypothetical protein SLA2020_514760 [Shorea laevis]